PMLPVPLPSMLPLPPMLPLPLPSMLPLPPMLPLPLPSMLPLPPMLPVPPTLPVPWSPTLPLPAMVSLLAVPVGWPSPLVSGGHKRHCFPAEIWRSIACANAGTVAVEPKNALAISTIPVPARR
ncbi:MAG: hypothetical protein EOR29_33040, partial [Mesorhizobium sp.]